MNAYVDATFYAQVKPEFSRLGERVVAAKVVAITQGKPDRPRGGVVVVRLTIRVPAAAFLPLRPEAIVVIPENMAATYPVKVEAGDPS